jgi:hypothetical protein
MPALTENQAPKPFRFASLPLSTEAWEKELERAADQVRLWFEEATKKFVPPTKQGCRRFASAAFELSHHDGPKSPPDRTTNYGQSFLKALDHRRKVEEQCLRLSAAYAPEQIGKQESVLRLIDQTERYTRKFLQHLALQKGGGTDPIRFLGDLALLLWAETNNGDVPKSKSPKGPLCRVIYKTLVAMKDDRKPETISAVLRGRRRQKNCVENR